MIHGRHVLGVPPFSMFSACRFTIGVQLEMSARETPSHQPKGTAMMLTPTEVRTAELTVHRFREGYDTDEVDDLLDACADTIETLTRALESIMKAKGMEPKGETK